MQIFLPNFDKTSEIFIFKNLKISAFGLCNCTYSVMQSDGNSFCGDVVLDSFDMEYRDKDSILDQQCVQLIS